MTVEAVTLREVHPDDVPIFYASQSDPEVDRMIAFIPRDPQDREGFIAHWERIRTQDTITARTILVGEQVAGFVMKFEYYGAPEVGYLILKDFWGKGVATQALALLLAQEPARPLRGVVAQDNAASLRVLQKCGFVITGEEIKPSRARGVDVPAYVLTLDHPAEA